MIGAFYFLMEFLFHTATFPSSGLAKPGNGDKFPGYARDRDSRDEDKFLAERLFMIVQDAFISVAKSRQSHAWR
jgi:hypothetical protein